MRKNKKSIVIFLGVTFLFWVTLYIYVPTLPTYVKMKADNLAMVGLVVCSRPRPERARSAQATSSVLEGDRHAVHLRRRGERCRR